MNLGQILRDVEFRRADAPEDAPWVHPLHPDLPYQAAEGLAKLMALTGETSGLLVTSEATWRWRKVPS